MEVTIREHTQQDLNKLLQDICSVVNSSRAEILSCMYRGGDPFANGSTALVSLCKRERFDIIKEIVVEKKDVLGQKFAALPPLISELCTCYENGRSNVYEILLLFEQYGLFGDWTHLYEWSTRAMLCLATARRKKIGYMEERLRDIDSEEEKYMKIVRELREEKRTIQKEIKELRKGL